jgi:hypothetical protein
MDATDERLVSQAFLSYSAAERLVEAFARAGQPLLAMESDRILELARHQTDFGSELESILDKYTLARTELHSGGIGKSMPGSAYLRLVESGWKMFLVRISNPERLTGPIRLVNRVGLPWILEGQLARGMKLR